MYNALLVFRVAVNRAVRDATAVLPVQRQWAVTAIFVLSNFCSRTKYGSQNLSGRTFIGSHILSYSTKTCPTTKYGTQNLSYPIFDLEQNTFQIDRELRFIRLKISQRI